MKDEKEKLAEILSAEEKTSAQETAEYIAEEGVSKSFPPLIYPHPYKVIDGYLFIERMTKQGGMSTPYWTKK